MISRITIEPGKTHILTHHRTLSTKADGTLPAPLRKERDRQAAELLRSRAEQLEAGTLESTGVHTDSRCVFGEEFVDA